MCQIFNMKRKNNRIGLVFLGPFPKGNVSTLRILSYCISLVKKGFFVKVYLISPTKEARINNEVKGIYKGVNYEYMTSITWKKNNPNIFYKFYFYLVGIFKSLYSIHKDDISILLTYHDELLASFLYRIFTLIKRMNYILDKTEYPSNRKKNIKYLLYDKIITITYELESFYVKMKKDDFSKVFLLPMTIDKNRYENSIKKSCVSFKYIAVVFGVHNRDGLLQTVLAYRDYVILDSDDSMKLVLIGDYEVLKEKHPEVMEIEKIINENNLNKLIDFKGLIPIDEVPNILINAECLLTTSLGYKSGGFPTKLGEYLLSGVPVIATNVGEISKYVSHEENILLTEPNNSQQIANSILYLKNNKSIAKKIGTNGRSLALVAFNADTYVDNLILFIKS